MITTGMLHDIVTEKALRKVQMIGLEKAQKKTTYNKYLQVGPTNTLIEYALTTGSLPLFSRNEEGESVHTFDIQQAFKTAIRQWKFDGGFMLTMEMEKFDLHGLTKKFTKELAAAAELTKDYYAADVLNNCTSTGADYVLADTKALLTTDHPLLDGSTFANKPTNDVDFGIAPLEAAAYYYEMIPNYSNLPTVPKEPKLIVTHPVNRPLVMKALSSEKVPFEVSNTANVVRTEWGWDVAFNRWLTDTNAWFVFPDEIEYNIMTISMPADLMVTYAPTNPRDKMVTSVEMFRVRFLDARDIYGSTGVS